MWVRYVYRPWTSAHGACTWYAVAEYDRAYYLMCHKLRYHTYGTAMLEVEEEGEEEEVEVEAEAEARP